ncbi:hypothetical protein KIN34_03330 [Cellulomonas sp. DKR-3]|uniref:ABC3 transporter permease protein domain-containing protein n=1 Tax=Cellulomonas fulva TaxID=2835530 RepID=A0ABS5TVZ4_9CELL|nr:hypothetical protein [Cellulomonas fulva]MBT0993318.1 hypothetical protein [Cellulomonas fulva]
MTGRRAGGVPVGHVARQAWAARGLLATAVVVLALVTFLAAAAPRLLDRAATDEVRAAVGAEGSALVVTTREDGDSVQGPDLGTADALTGTARLLATNLPDAVGDVVAPPVAALVGPELRAGTVLRQGAAASTPVLLRFAYLATTGRSGPGDVTDPEAGAVTWESGAAPSTALEPPDPSAPGPVPIEVGLSAEVADALGVQVGDTLEVEDLDGGPLDVRVVGVFRAVDPSDPVWRPAPTAVEPQVLGGRAARIGVTALTSALSVPAARAAVPADRTTTSYTLDVVPAALDAASSDEVARAVRALVASPSTLGLPGPPPAVSTRLDRLLDEARDRTAATTAQSAVVASGVVATALLVLVLSSSLLVRRRATVLAHQRALGATLPALARAAAAEALVLLVLGGGVGLVLAALVVPGPVPWAWVLPPLVLAALVPPVLTARTAAHTDAPPPARGARPGTALRRPLAEVTVVLLAAGALATLRGRGAASAADDLGADLVVVLAPALVAAAVAVLLLRLLPPLARWWRAAAARMRGPVPLVAAARTPVAVVPVLALVLATALLTVVLSLQTTVRAGQEAGSWTAVGGDVRLDAAPDPGLPEDLLDDLAAEPGVTAAAARVVDGTQVLGGGVDETARLVAIDADAEARLLARSPVGDAPGLAVLAAAPGAGADGATAVPALVAGVPADATGLHVAWQGDSVPLDVVGAAPALPLGDEAAPVTVVVDRAALAAALGRPVAATDAWLTGPGAAQAVTDLPDGVTATVRTAWLADVRVAPTAATFSHVLRAAAAVLAVLGVLVVVLAAAAGAPARRRALVQLRVLGLPRRVGARVVLAELVGPVLVPALAGIGTGIALSAAVVVPLGLQSLTHQAVAPALVLPWWVLASVLGLAGAVAGVVAVERPRAGNERLSEVMRSG